MEYIFPIILAMLVAFWIRKGAITRAWYDAQAQKLIKLPNGRYQLIFRSLAAFNKTSDAGFDIFMYLKLLFARSTTTAETSVMDLDSEDGFQIQNRLLSSTRCWYVGDDSQNWVSSLTCESYCMPLCWEPHKKSSWLTKFLFILGFKNTFGLKFMPKVRGLFTTEKDLMIMLNPENWKLIDVERPSHAQRILTTIEIAQIWDSERKKGEFILTQLEQMDLSMLEDLSNRVPPVQVDWRAKETSQLLFATRRKIQN